MQYNTEDANVTQILDQLNTSFKVKTRAKWTPKKCITLLKPFIVNVEKDINEIKTKE